MGYSRFDATTRHRPAWNAGKNVGTKRPLTQKQIWAAKNVSQDNLHLRVPVWITCMSFQNPVRDSFDGDSSVFYTGTAYRHVRMYDMKAGQQPTASLEIGPDFRVSAIQPAKGGDSDRLLYVADTSGSLTQWDLRTQRRVHTLKGAAGSIREMTLSEDGQQLACVGLDRFLRVYDTSSNKLTSSIYLKNRLNTCVFVAGHVAAPPKEVAVKAAKKSAEGARVDNEVDEDMLHELGDSSDEEEEEEEEEVGEEVEGSDEEVEGEEESGDEEDEEEQGSGEDSEGEGEEEDGSEEGSEGDEEGSADEGSDEEGSGSNDEGSEESEEEEVVTTFKWGGSSKAAAPAPAAAASKSKAVRPAPISAPAKKARR